VPPMAPTKASVACPAVRRAHARGPGRRLQPAGRRPARRHPRQAPLTDYEPQPRDGWAAARSAAAVRRLCIESNDVSRIGPEDRSARRPRAGAPGDYRLTLTDRLPGARSRAPDAGAAGNSRPTPGGPGGLPRRSAAASRAATRHGSVSTASTPGRLTRSCGSRTTGTPAS
jgi:hypothetical protein